MTAITRQWDRSWLRVALLGGLWTAAGLACQGSVSVPAPPTGGLISFATDVQPIFNARCTSCHSPGFPTNVVVGIRMVLTPDESFNALVNQTSSQRADLTLVVPGDPDASLLWLKVSSDGPPVGATMPLLGQRLTSSELANVRDWIAQGGQNN